MSIRLCIAILGVAAATFILALQPPDSVLADGPNVLVIEIDGIVDPLTADHIARGINKASKDGASLVVIQLDTPGGLLDSTRDIVESILESEVPVAVYVAPAGARAASAGTFVAAAANFAVMAPGTNIGAASPVASGGRDLPTTLSRKINQDTRAFIRSIAQVRGRNANALEDTVRKAAAYSAEEALKLGVIDLIATDMNQMLVQLDGLTATTPAGQELVSSSGAEVRRLHRTLLEHALRILANPNLVLGLFIIGGAALIVELVVPGQFGPGILAVLAIALGLVGFVNLPGSWVGVGLIAFAVALFYGETVAPGFSLFGLGGIISLILGSIFLFGNFFGPTDIPEPSFMVSPIMIGIVAGLAIGVWILFIKSTGTSSGFQTEAEALLEGQKGVALSDLQPSGQVRVSNEEWTATAGPGVSIKKGDEVQVVAVYGRVLKVDKHRQDQETSN